MAEIKIPPSFEERRARDFIEFLSSLIAEKIEKLKSYGKMPVDWEEWLVGFGQKLSEKGDELLYPSIDTAKKRSEFSTFLDEFTAALSLMSFFPGGVRFAGKHWESTFDGCSKA